MEMALRTSNLVLPQGFVEMDREEMMYVEGGVQARTRWWGLQVFFTANDVKDIQVALGLGTAGLTLVRAILATAAKASAAAAAGPYILLITAAVAFHLAVITAVNHFGGYKGVTLNWSWIALYAGNIGISWYTSGRY